MHLTERSKEFLQALGILLDMAAAGSFGTAVAVAGGLLWGLIGGALVFAVWGGLWGLYLGTMLPRPGQRPIDLQAACPANFCCPWETPWHPFSIRWAVGCGAGYSLQATLLGILPGTLVGMSSPWSVDKGRGTRGNNGYLR